MAHAEGNHHSGWGLCIKEPEVMRGTLPLVPVISTAYLQCLSVVLYALVIPQGSGLARLPVAE